MITFQVKKGQVMEHGDGNTSTARRDGFAYFDGDTFRMLPEEEGEREIIATYKALHKDKLGAHWLWVVIEQIAAGVPETQALREFDYYEKRPAGEVAKDAGWRDIESAPKEPGLHLLLSGVGWKGTRYVTVGSYEEDRDSWWEANTHWTDATGDGHVQATHWMPLPAPPSAANEGMTP